MSAYVSHGEEFHIDQLEGICFSGETEEWTVNRHVEPGDRILFYIHLPISGFVAIGTVLSRARAATRRDAWPGFIAAIRVDKMVEPPLYRPEATALFPEWGWLRTPRSSVKVPDNVEAELLQELERRATLRLSDQGATKPGTGIAVYGAGFGDDPEHNVRVEQAAIRAVWAWFEEEGWEILDRQADKVGGGFNSEAQHGVRR